MKVSAPYPVMLRFEKEFTQGTLAGISVHESMPFTSVKKAQQWVDTINSSPTLDWKVTGHYVDLLV